MSLTALTFIAGALVLIAMMTLFWLLSLASGVTMLERTMKVRPGFEEYMRKTNAFFPWFPKDLSL